jgi:hypothetical protein
MKYYEIDTCEVHVVEKRLKKGGERGQPPFPNASLDIDYRPTLAWDLTCYV